MYRIVEKKSLTPTLTKLTVEAPFVARKAQPGQFIILRVDENGERIPITVHDFDREKGTVTIIYQIVGATTKKLEQKSYYRVTGWIGGLKETKARIMMEKRSDYAVELAVKGMLPKNALGRSCMSRLHLYKGAEHPHAAQKPEAWTLD